MMNSLDLTLEAITKEHVIYVLSLTENNKAKAAQLLGVTNKTLYNWLHEWGLMEKYRVYDMRAKN